MKANEFRLGNLIYFGGEIDVITAISKGSLSFKSGFAMFIANEFEPIFLTEEWLLKAGFRKHSILYEIGSFAIKKWQHDNIEWVIFWNNNVIIYADKNYSLHQLQNFYFALTGTELDFAL